MAQMVKICEEFGEKNNLMFSTDTNPAKSKTKCLYMCGHRARNIVYPAPVQLYGRDLPWVTHATHLGHELHQDCNMDMDIKMKRAAFIKNTTDIRTQFSFALPGQVLNAICVYSAHFYGAMLWDLYGELSGQVYRSWNTCVKLVWDLPRSTHNYLVEQTLAKDSSVRKRILLQYASFLQRLGKSVSGEVRVMSRIAAADVQSVTGKNCYNMINLDPWTQPVRSFAKDYKMYETPAQDTWRSSLLLSLMREKYDMDVTGEDVETISGLIESLCSS
jgi:hypothetical protein